MNGKSDSVMHSLGPGRPKDLTSRDSRERRLKIYQLSLMGFSETEIARTLGLNQSSVSRQLNSVRHDHWNSNNETLKKRYARMVQECHDAVMLTVREAWRLFMNETKAECKNALLGRIQNGYHVLMEFLPTPSDIEIERQIDEATARMDEMKPTMQSWMEEQRLRTRIQPPIPSTAGS